MIRVLLVDDSPLALVILEKMLSSSPDIGVVGTARSGKEALELIPQLNPAVICMDFHMPEMDGLELTRQVMAERPTPILVVSVSVQDDQLHNIFPLLDAGAVDVFPKPRNGSEEEYRRLSRELVEKVKILSGVVVFRKKGKGPAQKNGPHHKDAAPARIVAIGASTGGPAALRAILSALPADFPAPVVCVQHIGEGFLESLVKWLASQCALKVKIAEPGEEPLPGTVYFPRENAHLEIGAKGGWMYTLDPPVDGHRPSVTATFRSVARHYGRSAAGILLTGMGEDGAEGLKDIADAGGIAIAQDEETSLIFGMPRKAISIGAARHVLPLNRIADALLISTGAKKS